MRSMVTPWVDDFVPSDAFRGPLAESFKLVETIRNYQLENKYLFEKVWNNIWLNEINCKFVIRISLNDICLHVENINSDVNVLPEYSCLLVSPTNLWHQNLEEFRTDNSLEKTIFTYQVFFKFTLNSFMMLS